jgi:hypothetical protein
MASKIKVITRRYHPLSEIQRGKFTCWYCSTRADSTADLQQHLTKQHPKWMEDAVRKIQGSHGENRVRVIENHDLVTAN